MLDLLMSASYWVLTLLWLIILSLYLFNLKHSRTAGSAIGVLLVLLSIDAFRTLFESVYFGLYFNSMFGFLPAEIYTALSQPAAIIAPKLINIVVGVLILIILIRRWIPREIRLREEWIQNLQASQATLRQSKENYQRIFENLQEVYYEATVDGTLLEISPSISNLSQYSRDDLLGKPILDFYTDSKERDDLLGLLLEQTQIKNYKIHLKDKDGSQRLCSITAKLMRDAHGVPARLIGSIRDISENEKISELLQVQVSELEVSQKLLKESEGRFKALHEASFGAVIIHDNGLILDCNQALSEMSGYSNEELIGMNGFKLIAPDSLPLVKENVSKGYDQRYEVEGRRKDGSLFPLAIRGKNIVYQGRQARVIEFRDITNSRRAEMERIQLNRQLQAKNKELEQMLYVASHDLRSPLVNINGHGMELSSCFDELRCVLDGSQLSVEERARVVPLLDQEIPEALRIIKASTSKMDALLVGLLKVSRSGRVPSETVALDMNALVSDVINTSEFQIKETGVSLQVSPLPSCLGNSLQVSQVFSNLLDNALKYLDPGRAGQISINGWTDPEHSVYCVEDNGIGIDQAHQKNIFEIFHRLDPDRGEGDGLGLNIVQQILGSMSGSIRVESEPGVGSRFYVTLPKAATPG